jgi:signal transduction histidine kinase
MNKESGESKLREQIAELLLENERLKYERDRIAGKLRHNEEYLEKFIRRTLHDLRSPLATVSNMVQLLALRHRGQLDERAGELVGHATEAIERGDALLCGLATYVAARTGHETPEPFALEEALDAALARLDPLMRESNAEITTGKLPSVVGSKADLEQVFIQLIGNALKFRGDAAPRIHVSTKVDAGQCAIQVQDNGIGMEQRFVNQIFEPYERLGGREYDGSGLGLAICKKIVERHDGRLWAESAPGKGTVFFFTLPGAANRAAV